ncbi:transposase [Arenimonas oryziterrae]|uniref:Transposase IS200-like domain-containing protein n=1 Tax=Arenimonas oryziterrae DSM 21050 = YC6267 TaxID=1121015 RepID=A0A091APW5_9GAMM|nr:transposase [Arenimonas oryziterrae]KFN41406.1 hypothetical protein N789_05890 [Arenimonas oryziterrae DSM 21050 = YC6267]
MPLLTPACPPGTTWHLSFQGRRRHACLTTPGDFRQYLLRLRAVALRRACAVHAYALMPDRVQLLVTALLADSLRGLVHDQIRHGAGKYGSPWLSRHDCRAIDGEHHLLAAMRQVETAPVRAGLAACACVYPWSSHRANAEGQRDALLSPHRVYLALGRTTNERRAAYRGLCRESDDAALAARLAQAGSEHEAIGSAPFLPDACEDSTPVVFEPAPWPALPAAARGAMIDA